MISINPNINFLDKNKYALILSITLMLVSIISLSILGLNLGIDFTKGTRLDFETNSNINQVRLSINETKIKDNYTIKKV